MSIVVKDVLMLPLLASANIVSGEREIDKAKVSWGAVIEETVENFVRKDEFILTTGFGYGQDAVGFLEFLKNIYDTGVSAIAIATGRYIYDIPPEVKEYTLANNLILIELPWEVHFAEIPREITDRINRDQREMAERSSEVQQKLIDFVIRGKSLRDIIIFVERKIGADIMYKDIHRTKWGHADKDKMNIMYDKLRDGEHQLFTTDDSHIQHVDEFLYNDKLVIKKGIYAGEIHQGDCYIAFVSKTRLSTFDYHVIEHLSAAIALWLSREIAIIETEIRLRNDFIWNLIKTPEPPLEEMATRARLLGYNLRLPYTCIIGSSNNDETFKLPHQEQVDLKSIIYYIEEEVRYAAKVVDRRLAFTFDNDLLIMFLEIEDNTLEVGINHFLDLVEKRLNILLPGVTFSWGIGKHLDGVLSFYDSYMKAKSALDMGRKQHGLGNRHYFSDTRMNQLLLQIAGEKEVQSLTKTTLAPLLEYEEKRDMNLLETFMAYNKHNGNVSQTARMLNLHRQSLLYRLRKIETLTGLLLVNPDDIFLLEFSIRIWSTGLIEDE